MITLEDYGWIQQMLKEKGIDNDCLLIGDVKKVYEKMKEVARKGKNNNKEGIIFYGKIMEIANLDRENTYHRKTLLRKMLWGISEHEKECKRPLLSAVVVRKDKPPMPGKGFYYFNDTDMSDEEFWIKEINKVWDHWKP